MLLPHSCLMTLLTGFLAVSIGASANPGSPPGFADLREYASFGRAIREARNLKNQHRFKEARLSLGPCLQAIPDHAEAHYLLAQMAYEEQRYEEALSHTQQAERTFLKLEQMARIELEAAEARAASLEAELQSSLIGLDAAGVDPRGCSGNLFTSRQHNLNDQRQKLGRIEGPSDIQSVPTELYLLKGNCFYRLKRFNEAEICYQQVTRMDPGAPTAWNNLIGLHLSAGNLPTAKKWFSQATKEGIPVRPELRKAILENGDL